MKKWTEWNEMLQLFDLIAVAVVVVGDAIAIVYSECIHHQIKMSHDLWQLILFARRRSANKFTLTVHIRLLLFAIQSRRRAKRGMKDAWSAREREKASEIERERERANYRRSGASAGYEAIANEHAKQANAI